MIRDTPSPSTRKHRKLILITGAPRSGTTWVGRVLASTPRSNYLLEPFNLERATRYFTFLPLSTWFQRLTEADVARFQPLFADLIAGHRVCGLDEPAGWRRVNPIARMARAARLAKRKLDGRLAETVVLKDPIALCSADWFHRYLHSQNVVMIRHPAGIASSIKVQQWWFDYERLLHNESVAERFFPGERARIEKLPRGDDEILFRACVLWRLMHLVIRRYQREFPNWVFLKHEELAAHPQEAFRDLFVRLGLPFGESTQSFLETTSQQPAPQAAPTAALRTDNVIRRSEATVFVWKERLTTAEQKLVREATADVAEGFYTEADWGRA